MKAFVADIFDVRKCHPLQKTFVCALGGLVHRCQIGKARHALRKGKAYGICGSIPAGIAQKLCKINCGIFQQFFRKDFRIFRNIYENRWNVFCLIVFELSKERIAIGIGSPFGARQ